MFLVLRQEREFERRAACRHFSVVDLPRRQPELLDALVAQIDHEGEIDFPLRLAGDLENDDPGRIGIESGLLDRLPHDDFGMRRLDDDALNIQLPP